MPISIAAAFAVWKFPKATALAQGNEWPILFAQLFLLGICFAITASGAFEPENPSELLSDTKGDVFWVIVTSNTLTYLYVDNGFTIYWLPITMLALSAGVAILDLWISLEEALQNSKNWIKAGYQSEDRYLIHNPKKSPCSNAGALKL